MKKLFFRLKLLLKPNRGFSLVELSVVISVAASATVGMLAWTQPTSATNALKSAETTKRMQEIQKAIENFRVLNKRLPCPADPLMRNDNTRAPLGTNYLIPTGASTNSYKNDYGMEDLYTSEASGLITPGVNCPISVGAVPVFSLGLDESYITDGWGRLFTYHVSPSLCGIDTYTTADLANAATEKVGCTEKDYRNKTGTIFVDNYAATVSLTKSAAFTLVSHGVNGFGAFLPSGVKLPASADAKEVENSDGDTSYVKNIQTTVFDDIVVFETKNYLESLSNRKSVKHLTVEQCQANSQALSKVTLTEVAAMKAMTSYQQNTIDASAIQNTGDKALLGILKATQTICVSYYGAAPATINGKTWSGAQCPGNRNPHPDATPFVSTYTAATDSCVCASGLWDGNCGPVVTFVPTDVTTLQIWLDASDSSKMSTGNCTTSVIPTNGQTIGCWKDKSGNGRDFWSGATYSTGIQNSKSILVHTAPDWCSGTGISGNLGITSGGWTAINMFNVVRVGTSGPISGGGRLISLGTNNDGNCNLSNNNGFNMMMTGSGELFQFCQATNVLSGAALTLAPGSTFAVYSLIGDGGLLKVYKNGVQVGSSVGAGAGPYSPTKLVLGYSVEQGCWRTSFDEAEFLLYSKSLSLTERQNIENYLISKWAIQ